MEFDERRDFFPAFLIAQKANEGRPEHKVAVSVGDILEMRYPKKDSDVMITDPDRGAAGDWRGLKDGLKGTTAKSKAKRAVLKVHDGS